MEGITQSDLEFYLSKRYCQPEWAFFPQVRSSTGYANRIADGIAMNMYRSRKYEIHGFEIKVSREDWLKELKNPQKADEIFEYCDKWWLVVSDKNIVQKGELPKGWGLMVVRGKGLVIKIRGDYNEAKIIDLGFIASLLRSASEGMMPKDIIQQKIDDAWEKGKNSQDYEIQSAEKKTKLYENIIKTFEKEAGVKIEKWYGMENAKKVGLALRRILAKEDSAIKWNLKSAEDSVKRILEEIEKLKELK